MHNSNSNSGETSVIAKETSIKGDIDFAGKLVVEGHLESQVKGVEITIQKSGVLNGALDVKSLNCYGQIDGDVTADSVIIHSGAIVAGAISTTTLEIEPGAVINGSITMKIPKTASIKQIDHKFADNKK